MNRARAALKSSGADGDSSDAAGWLALYEGNLKVARGLLRGGTESSPELVFGSVTEEVGTLLGFDHAALLRYETDGTASVLAAWSRDGRHLPVGSRWPVEGDTVAAAVQELLAQHGWLTPPQAVHWPSAVQIVPLPH